MKIKALIPDYMFHFSCIGAACPDSCCSTNWDIVCDRKTYEKYSRINDEELKKAFVQYVIQTKDPLSDAFYAKIHLKENGACPFLSEDKLCHLVKKLGPDALSDTCNYYPRAINLINQDRVEISLHMSCPFAAEVALLSKKPIEFVFADFDLRESLNLFKKIDLDCSILKANHYFDSLRKFCLAVLQNRKLGIGERLLFLGMFFQKLNELETLGKAAQIPELIGKYENILKEEGFLIKNLTAIPEDYSIQMNLLKSLIDLTSHKEPLSVYANCYHDFIKGLDLQNNPGQTELIGKYRTLYSAYYLPFIKEREFIFENYFVNYVFKNLFPFHPERNLYEEYVILVLHYAIMKMLLIGISGSYSGLDEKQVTKLIQSFSKKAEHYPKYIENMMKILKSHGHTSLAYMAILIKN